MHIIRDARFSLYILFVEYYESMYPKIFPKDELYSDIDDLGNYSEERDEYMRPHGFNYISHLEKHHKVVEKIRVKMNNIFDKYVEKLNENNQHNSIIALANEVADEMVFR